MGTVHIIIVHNISPTFTVSSSIVRRIAFLRIIIITYIVSCIPVLITYM